MCFQNIFEFQDVAYFQDVAAKQNKTTDCIMKWHEGKSFSAHKYSLNGI